MTWLHPYWNQVSAQLSLHDWTQSALAAAVVVLGLVILLELRSVVQLRQATDRGLARVFEQLDLLRFESQQFIDAQSRPAMPATGPTEAALLVATDTDGAADPRRTAQAAATPQGTPATPMAARALRSGAPGIYQDVATLAASGLPVKEIAERCGLATGEVRLLASLAERRARRPSSSAG